MTHTLKVWLEFEDAAAAADALAQMQARATLTRIVAAGTEAERTSYARLTDDDGAFVGGFWVDTFGIVRQGEPAAPPRDYPLWIQPTGAHDAYPATDAAGRPTRVEHNGRNWQNAHGNGNIWEPGSFGWTDLGEV